MNPLSPGRVSISCKKDVNEKKKPELLSIPADLASTGMANVPYVDICKDINMAEVEMLSSRGAEYFHSTKNNK